MEQTTLTIEVTEPCAEAITGIQHPGGTYRFYRATLDRMFNTVLHLSDELGMDDRETVATLRAIDGLRRDLAAIAGPVSRHKCRQTPTEEEIAERVEETFTDIDDIHDSYYPRPADESADGGSE